MKGQSYLVRDLDNGSYAMVTVSDDKKLVIHPSGERESSLKGITLALEDAIYRGVLKEGMEVSVGEQYSRTNGIGGVDRKHEGYAGEVLLTSDVLKYKGMTGKDIERSVYPKNHEIFCIVSEADLNRIVGKYLEVLMNNAEYKVKREETMLDKDNNRIICLHPSRYFIDGGNPKVRSYLSREVKDTLSNEGILVFYRKDASKLNVSNTKLKKIIHQFKNGARLDLSRL